MSCPSSVCHQISCSFGSYKFLNIGLYPLTVHFTSSQPFSFIYILISSQIPVSVNWSVTSNSCFSPYTFCALPHLLLFSLYCLGTGSRAGLLIILLSGVGFSTETVSCSSSWAMAKKANCNSTGWTGHSNEYDNYSALGCAAVWIGI